MSTTALVCNAAVWLAFVALIADELIARRHGRRAVMTRIWRRQAPRQRMLGLAGLLLFETCWLLLAVTHIQRHSVRVALGLDYAGYAIGFAGLILLFASAAAQPRQPGR